MRTTLKDKLFEDSFLVFIWWLPFEEYFVAIIIIIVIIFCRHRFSVKLLNDDKRPCRIISSIKTLQILNVKSTGGTDYFRLIWIESENLWRSFCRRWKCQSQMIKAVGSPSSSSPPVKEPLFCAVLAVLGACPSYRLFAVFRYIVAAIDIIDKWWIIDQTGSFNSSDQIKWSSFSLQRVQ